MDKLLNWSLANSTDDDQLKEKVGQPNPELLSKLFGPDEPTLMKQNMSVILHKDADLENKEIAFDNFEMLIENLDNANNIENMKLWEPLISQLYVDEVSMRRFACSIIGSAVQNNPTSQEAFLKYDNGISRLIELAASSEEPQEVTLKALYALSSIIRHNKEAYEVFSKHNGWGLLSHLDTESKDSFKLRALSLLSALLSTDFSEEKLTHIHNGKLVTKIVSLFRSDGNLNCIDKGLNIISLLAAEQYKFDADEVKGITDGLKNIEPVKDQLSEDDFQNVKQVIF